MEFKLALQLFADENNPNLNTNVTTALPIEMKVFYNTSLLENARNQHYFNQFGMKQPLPKNGGNQVEWRKFDTYAPALTALTEGVTPDGNTVSLKSIPAEIAQYGDYTTISDRLELEAVDPVITAVTEEHGAQAGDTLEIITINELLTNAVKRYANNKTSSTIAKTDLISSTLINQAATDLKKQKAPTINGDYICVIHPSVAFDLRESTGWLDVHKYAEPSEIYNGEIGKLHGVRFIESTLAPVVKASDTAPAFYHSIMFGKDAWGIIEPSAESLEVIVKQRGSAGTSDPLDQRSTVGWKASHAAKILYKERIVDIVSGSSFSDVDDDNTK